MRPPELETGIEVFEDREGVASDSTLALTCPCGECRREYVYVEVAPGEAGEIAKRIAMYPDLVEACRGMCDVLRALDRAEALTAEEAHATVVGMAVLARCKGEPDVT